MTASSRGALTVGLACCLVALVHGKACEGENLPKDSPLRIGKKFRPETCDKWSKPGDKLKMHYTGKLYSDCSTFDSSVERGDPFEFKLGKGEVIKGWDDGLRGMCVGEKRKLTIPSDLAYGDGGSGESIPGGSTLQFDVELLDIKEQAAKKKRKKKKSKKKKVKDEM